MMLRRPSQIRRGSYAVEFAIVAQVFFMIVLGQVMGAMAVFNYVETVNLAREGARYASVHGWLWQQDVINGTGPWTQNATQAATASTDVYNNAIKPRVVGMDTTNVNNGGALTYTITWGSGGQMQYYYDTSSGTYKQNTVTCTVSYQFNPIVKMLFPFLKDTVSSTSTVAMQY